MNIVLASVLAAGDRKLSRSSCGLLSAAAPGERICRRKVQGLHVGFVLVALPPSRQRREHQKSFYVIASGCLSIQWHNTAVQSAERLRGNANPTKLNCSMLVLNLRNRVKGQLQKCNVFLTLSSVPE